MSRAGEISIIAILIAGFGMMYYKIDTAANMVRDACDEVIFKIGEIRSVNSKSAFAADTLRVQVEDAISDVSKDIDTLYKRIEALDFDGIKEKCNNVSLLLDNMFNKWPSKLREVEISFSNAIDTLEGNFKMLLSKSNARLENGLSEAQEHISSSDNEIKRLQYDLRSCKNDIKSIYEDLQEIDTRTRRRN